MEKIKKIKLKQIKPSLNEVLTELSEDRIIKYLQGVVRSNFTFENDRNYFLIAYYSVYHNKRCIDIKIKSSIKQKPMPYNNEFIFKNISWIKDVRKKYIETGKMDYYEFLWFLGENENNCY